MTLAGETGTLARLVMLTEPKDMCHASEDANGLQNSLPCYAGDACSLHLETLDAECDHGIRVIGIFLRLISV